MDRSSDWLKQAKRDIEKAKLDFEHEFYEWACFTSQQSAEKAVKAVFQSQNKSVRGHSILRMLQGLKEDFDVSGCMHPARLLDRYYIEARYPNGFPEGSPAEYFDVKIAQEALDAANKIIRFCENIVNQSRAAD
jgi:HEPN domain-containing protein